MTLFELRTAPGHWNDRPDEMVSQHGATPGLAVRAPAHGVVLEFHWTTIRFELAGDLESEDEGSLLLKTPSGHPRTPADLETNRMSIPEYWSAKYSLSGNEPTFVVQARPKLHMTGEVAFPGRQPVPLDFTTPEAGGEVVVPVELVRGEEVATLVIALENPSAELPETFTVKTIRAGHDDAPPDTREVEVVDGQMRVEGLLPGKYRVRVRPGEDRYYASGLFFVNEFEVELRPGLVATQSIRLRKGAGLRLTVRGDDGQLVATMRRQGAEGDAEADAGIRLKVICKVFSRSLECSRCPGGQVHQFDF